MDVVADARAVAGRVVLAEDGDLATQSRQVEYTGRSRFSVSWPGSSDIDFYVYDPAGKERGRAFTLSNPETLDVVLDTTGTWSVRVNLYAGSGGAYTLTWFVPEAILS
jgi:hypothetical protein